VKSYERQERKHVNVGADWIQERGRPSRTQNCRRVSARERSFMPRAKAAVARMTV
jgi:hypothetical protein